MNIGHFGPGIIGEEQAALEAKIADRAEDKFGPGILDPDATTPAYKRAPLAVPPEMITALAQAVENGTVAPSVDEPGEQGPGFLTMSIADLATALEANPDDFDRLMQLEFKRPEGPRKGACRALLKAEQAHETPRAEVLVVLREVIGGDQ